MLKMEAQQPKEAIVYFDKAIQQGGDRTDLIFNLAAAFVAANDTRSAFRYLGEYINRSDPAQAENIKVANLLRNQMLEEAREAEGEGRGTEEPVNARRAAPSRVLFGT